MPVVQHHVTRPDGSPAVLLDVHIDLITGDQSRTAFRRSDRTGLAARIELTPDGDGWSADLVPLSDVQPTGSVYRVTVHIEDAPRQVWHFTIPASGGPFELVDLLVDPPDGPQAIIIGDSIAAIGLHDVDPAAHADIRALIASSSAGGGAVRLAEARTASGSLSGHRVVTPGPDGRVGYASNTAAEHVNAPLWLTLSAALAETQVTVLMAGEATEPSWSWSPGPVYLGAGGALTQTPPGAGAVFSAQIGAATSPTTVHIDRQPSIVLA